MFVGKDFVLKHIRVKHAEKVDEFKNKVGHHFATNVLAQMRVPHLSVRVPQFVYTCSYVL